MMPLTLRLWKHVLCLLFSFFVSGLAFGQNSELIKLEHDLVLAKDSLTAMRLMNNIGFLIHMKSADSTFYYGVNANRIAERFNNTRGRADALTNIAIGLTLKGLYSQSLNYYGKAYQAYAKLNDKAEMAQMFMNSAISYSFTKDNSRTKEFAKRALNTAIALKDDSAISILYANYAELGGLKADSVDFYLNKAEKIAMKFHDDRTLLYILQEKAQLLLRSKNNQLALVLIRQSLMLARKHQWDYHELESLNLYGSYFMAIKQPDSAQRCYRQIYNEANANGYVYWNVEVLKSILQVYQLKHDAGKQAETNHLLVEALEKQNNSNNSFVGDYIKFNANSEELEKLHALNTLNHKKQLWFIIASVIGIFTTLVILWVYVRSRKHRKILNALNEKITNQNQALKSEDEFKSRLLTMLAHDFRAPLGQTLGMISLLRDDELDEKTKLRSFNSIETDVQNILVTFDNILQWIKKQLTGYDFIPEELNLYELVAQSAGMFKQVMDAKEITFHNIPYPDFIIKSDREIIQFINRNLIHNAIKYSPQKGTITVAVKNVDDEIIVSLTNEGEGMTEEQLDNLFTFSKQESNESGAGMALTLCREFITLLQGKIWADSEPGKRTTFYYSLPG